MNFFREQFNKFLLTGLLLLVGLLILHALHHGSADDGLLAWAQQTFATILGALLLLITGRAAFPRNGTGGVNGSSGNGAASGPGSGPRSGAGIAAAAPGAYGTGNLGVS